MKTELYPLKFRPILKEKIWGGKKLKTLLGRVSDSGHIGESWEISAIPDSVSKVVNGPLAGKDLAWLINEFREKLVGEIVFETYGGEFPLLFKFIDAAENLSLQLHPDDDLAKKRHNSFGKTEMWYILQADESSGLYVGFKGGTTKEDYLAHLKTGTLETLMNFEPVRPGDVFFINPGLVHAIGKGVLLAEIQQSSDITYRVFDWNRKDAQGNSRDLHTDFALEAIDFEKKEYKRHSGKGVNVWKDLVIDKYFRTRKICMTKSLSVDYSATDSFVVLMCIAGEVRVDCQNGGAGESLKMGETMLLPACLNGISLQAENVELLEIRV